MELAYHVARGLSVAVFLFHGIACLLAPSMVAEFERYGLARLRRLTGSLEILGALGLLAGSFFPPLVPAAAGGLSLLMLAGVGLRVRIGDPLVALLPALLLLLLNAGVLAYALRGAAE